MIDVILEKILSHARQASMVGLMKCALQALGVQAKGGHRHDLG